MLSFRVEGTSQDLEVRDRSRFDLLVHVPFQFFFVEAQFARLSAQIEI